MGLFGKDEKEKLLKAAEQGDAVVSRSSSESKVGEIVEFGGIEWRVLELSEGKVLLLSEYVLEYRAYNEELTDVTWETCTLRSYLNGEFLNRFSESDRARIAPTRNSNKDNQWSGIPGGNDTDDYIFLLSLEEVVRYFGDSGQLANMPGDAYGGINDQYNEARIAYSAVESPWGEPAGIASVWWLRSPGSTSDSFGGAYVLGGGNIYVYGVTVLGDTGVRPALWLNLE
jgi:hypothetical protein